MADVEQRLSRMEELIGQLIHMVAKNNEIVTGLRADMVEMKADMAEMKADMVAMKADMAEMKADMAQVKADMLAMEGRLTQRIDSVRDEVVLLHAHSNHFAQKIGLLERDVAEVRGRS